MKKVLMVLLASTFVFGCASTNDSIPAADIEFARADYKMTGDTSAEECATSILGLHWGYLFSSDTGDLRSGVVGFPSFGPFISGPRSVAVRKALDKLQGATHATATRNYTDASGIPFFFMKTCEKVKTRGVAIGTAHALSQN